MEKLIIKNFGPISDAEVVIRDLNIFIGTTSSGKSTVAKLISIFKGTAIRAVINVEKFSTLLADFNIDFEIRVDTFIRYEKNNYYFEINESLFDTNSHSIENNPPFVPIYIPAERMFFPTFSQSIFGLINNNINLPKWLVDFGAKFEKARSSLKRFGIGFLKVGYENENNNDYVSISDNVKIKLSQASSGLQSVIPLILVIQYNTSPRKLNTDIFVIEEPELNLYPSSQRDLIEYIIGRMNQSKTEMIITTHSPYLLTAIDNLIQAQNIVDLNKSLKDEVENIIPKSLWLKFDRVSCYYFDQGTCRSTLDMENKSIGPSNIDDVSINISDTFEKLLLLKYPA